MSNTGHMGFTTRGLFTGECAQTAATEKMSALNDITVGRATKSDGGQEFFLEMGWGSLVLSSENVGVLVGGFIVDVLSG